MERMDIEDKEESKEETEDGGGLEDLIDDY